MDINGCCHCNGHIIIFFIKMYTIFSIAFGILFMIRLGMEEESNARTIVTILLVICGLIVVMFCLSEPGYDFGPYHRGGSRQ